MTWQQKAFIQKIFSALPFSYGVKLNFLCQKYITKGLPRSFEGFKGCYQGKVEKAFNSFKKYTNLKDFSSKSYFEFGAGWDLITPIGMSRKGMGHTYIIDIRELIIPSLIKTTISQYDKLLGYTSKQLGGGVIQRIYCKTPIILITQSKTLHAQTSLLVAWILSLLMLF